jgi:ferredoxin--NADP+ reductase
MSQNHPLRVAIVGAGPSGFYGAESVLKQRPDAIVDLFERLPAPFGLVRYGVAPDHQKIKSVTKVYDRLLADPRLRYRGNVEIGRDLSLDDLRRHYHAILFTYGAALDRALGIPGEDLEGSFSATDFVAWYNGHPDFERLNPNLSGHTALVVGVGNVAVDVTRVLAKTREELAPSDIADYALAALAASDVRDVIVIARRGPAEAKWSTKELRDLGELADADLVIDPADLNIPEASRAALEQDAGAKRNFEVLQALAARPLRGLAKRIHLRFLLSPIAIEPDASGSRVGSVVVERNELKLRPDGSLAAAGTGVTERIAAQLVFRSIGYRGAGIPGLPFDEGWSVVPHAAGRVLSERGGEPVPGLYVAGWIKRGPTGVIGTNKACAVESVTSMLADPLAIISAADADPGAIDALLAERDVQVVDADGWRRIDAAELTAGERTGQPRAKFTSIAGLLAASRG